MGKYLVAHFTMMALTHAFSMRRQSKFSRRLAVQQARIHIHEHSSHRCMHVKEPRWSDIVDCSRRASSVGLPRSSKAVMLVIASL